MIWPNLIDSRVNSKTKIDLKDEGLSVYVHFDLQNHRRGQGRRDRGRGRGDHGRGRGKRGNGNNCKEEEAETSTMVRTRIRRTASDRYKNKSMSKIRDKRNANKRGHDADVNADADADADASVDYDFTRGYSDSFSSRCSSNSKSESKSNSHSRSKSEPFTNLKKKLYIYAGANNTSYNGNININGNVSSNIHTSVNYNKTPSSPSPLPSPSVSPSGSAAGSRAGVGAGATTPLRNNSTKYTSSSPLSVISETALRIPTLSQIPKTRKMQQNSNTNTNTDTTNGNTTLSVSSSSSWSSASTSNNDTNTVSSSPYNIHTTRRRLYSWANTLTNNNKNNDYNYHNNDNMNDDIDLVMAGEQQRHSFDDYYHNQNQHQRNKNRNFDIVDYERDNDSRGYNDNTYDDEYDIDENGFENDVDDYDNDDCNVSLSSVNTSGSEVTQVQGASIRIDNNDGVIAFKFNDTNNNKNDDGNDEDGEEGSGNVHINVNQEEEESNESNTSSNSDDNGDYNGGNDNDIMNASIYYMDLSELTANNDKSNGNSSNNSNSNFELSSTTLQEDRDNEVKQFHSVRSTCLEVAAEHYKELNIEIPDIIVAQVNEHRNQLKDCDKKQKQKSFNTKEGGNAKSRKDTTHDKSARAGTTSNRDKNNTKHRAKLTKQKQRHQIRLCRSDEIHVSPCQCALSLVGMRAKVSESGHDSCWDGGESLFGNLLATASSNTNSFCKTTTHDSVYDGDEQGKEGQTSSIFPKKKAINSSLVRTSSANVREVKNNVSTSASSPSGHHNFKGKASSSGSSNEHSGNAHNKNRKPNQITSHTRTDSGTFDAFGYHEITLIRNRETTPKGIFSYYNGRNTPKGTKNNSNINYYDEFLDWDAVTIRCSNHDELDILVKALKDTSKATVVPFSSNPKERLKQNKEKRKKEKKLVAQQQRRRMQSDSSHPLFVNSNTSPRSFDGSQHCSSSCDSLKEDRQLNEVLSDDRSLATKKSDMDDNQLDSQTEHELCDTTHMESNSKKENEKRSWDFNFNKKEYCELCGLVFTLLTRRHHCRKCERSCCANCSSLLLIKGGDEKRFCNMCSAEILRKQSEALRGRWKIRSSQSGRLPGKVHPACHRLGVGTAGKLPHWKTFMTTKVDERPAVGRVTIEVLEGIALPSIDMLNGKTDPYVRATITGYDRDMMWTLREWMQPKRFSLCSGYVSSTLSPQWRGSGRKGGELLTLPLISTAGAVLRLEVLHYNVMTNARGKDTVLGVVEIPLSDLPNANLRQPSGMKINSNGKRKNMLYDGYCDRWYRLLSSDEVGSNSVVLSKPVPSPHSKEAVDKKKKAGAGIKSLEEIGKKVQGLCVQPIEWIASAIKLDLPARRPEVICKEHRARSFIHVRIKLNASVQGDILSHSWFPPVKPRPSVPPFEPQVLFGRIMHVSRQFAPFRAIQQYIEKVIKWEHEPKVCVRAYFIFAVHLTLLPYLVKIFHIYLIIFLGIRLREMKLQSADDDSITGEIPQIDSMNNDDMHFDNSKNEVNFHDSPSLIDLNERNKNVGGNGPKSTNTKEERPSNDVKNDDETARLNIAVNWIAKRWLDNKGLEILQFKLGMLGRDLKNLNSVWNGTNPLLTRAAMVYLVVSFTLHFIINPRLLWLMGTFTWYFGRSPAFILCARIFFGFWRGVAKGLRRQQLLDAEILDTI